MQEHPVIRQQSATIGARPNSSSEVAQPPSWSNYLDLPAILAAPDEPLDFVLPGLLAGTVGFLVSPGGTGKSMLALGLAAAVAAGLDAWGLIGSDPRPGPVLVLSLEDPAVILGRRLRALDASRPGMLQVAAQAGRLRVAARQGTGFTLGGWDPKLGMTPSAAYTVLRSEIGELRPRLLVVDTLNRALGGLAENDNAIQGAVIGMVEQLIAPTGTAALVLHHTGKGATLAGRGDTQQSARGASAITDNARFQLNLIGMTEEEAKSRGMPAEDRRGWVRTTVTKANYAPEPADRWLWRDKGGVLCGQDPPSILKVKPTKRGRPHDAD